MFGQDLADLSLFQGFNLQQTRQVLPILEALHFAEGETIFLQGDPAEFLFIVISGEARVDHKPYDGPPLTVARVTAGSVFGWSAALGRSEYTSAAFAVSDLHALRLRSTHLRQLCEHDPETGSLLVQRLAEAIAERLHNTYAEILSILKSGMELSA